MEQLVTSERLGPTLVQRRWDDVAPGQRPVPQIATDREVSRRGTLECDYADGFLAVTSEVAARGLPYQKRQPSRRVATSRMPSRRNSRA